MWDIFNFVIYSFNSVISNVFIFTRFMRNLALYNLGLTVVKEIQIEDKDNLTEILIDEKETAVSENTQDPSSREQSEDLNCNFKGIIPAQAMDKLEDASVLAFVESAVHKKICDESNHTEHVRNCKKMVRVVFHTRRCPQRKTNECKVCLDMLQVCLRHAKVCDNDDECDVDFCSTISPTLKELERQKQTKEMINRLESHKLRFEENVMKIKRSLDHAKVCTGNMTGGCALCKKLITMGYVRAKYYIDERHCNMMFTKSVKLKLKERQVQKQMLLQLEPDPDLLQSWNTKYKRFHMIVDKALAKLEGTVPASTPDEETIEKLVDESKPTNLTVSGTKTVSQEIATDTAPDITDWRQSLNANLRSHLIQKLIEAMMPSSIDSIMLDELKETARRKEHEVYESSFNSLQYNQKLAEMIYVARVEKYKNRKFDSDRKIKLIL